MDHNKALLVYSGWLGDFVWIIPTIRALKSRFSSLFMVVSDVQSPFAELFAGSLLDHTITDRRHDRMTSAREARSTARSADIGTFVDIKGRGKSGLYIPWQSGSHVFTPSRKDAREYTLSKLIHPLAREMPERATGVHMVDSYMGIAKFLGASNTTVSFEIPFSRNTHEEASQIVEEHHLDNGRTVAINLGSAQFSKIWSAAKYRQLAEALEDKMNCRVIVMGASQFAPNNNYDVMAAREHFGDGRFLNLVATTDIAVDCCLLRSGHIDLAIGNDSFAGHVAGSVDEVPAGTKGAVPDDTGKYFKGGYTVSLFGPTNPMFCRPYDPTNHFNRIVQPETYPPDCPYNQQDHICRHYKDAYCVERNHCMDMITVDQVLEAAREQMERHESHQ